MQGNVQLTAATADCTLNNYTTPERETFHDVHTFAHTLHRGSIIKPYACSFQSQKQMALFEDKDGRELFNGAEERYDEQCPPNTNARDQAQDQMECS